MPPLPPALEPMQDDRDQLVSIVDELDAALEGERRADLAGELVRFAARYEDVMERAVYPVLADRLGDGDLRRLEEDGARVREALADVRGHTRHVKPINVHLADPEGFERAVDDLVAMVRRSLEHESDDLLPLVEQLGPDARDDLRRRVARAVSRASEHPKPPRNPVARAIVNIEEKLDRTFEDASTTSHPAVDHPRERHPANGRDRSEGTGR